MNWLKQLFTRAPKIDDPIFGTITRGKDSWLSLPDAARPHLVILGGDAAGPSEQQRSQYAEIIQRIDLLTDQSIVYLRSQPEYAESIGTSNLELHAIIITDGSAGEELDFTLEYSPDQDAIYGVNFVAGCAVDCYYDH